MYKVHVQTTRHKHMARKKNKMSKKGRVAVVGLFYVKTANTLQDTG